MRLTALVRKTKAALLEEGDFLYSNSEDNKRKALHTLDAAWSKTAPLDQKYALIGTQALMAYGGAETAADIDIMVLRPRNVYEELRKELVREWGWETFNWAGRVRHHINNVAVADVSGLEDDPDPGYNRADSPTLVYRAKTPEGVIVDLTMAAVLASHKEMVEKAKPMLLCPTATACGVAIPVAPLGGVLLLKGKANRDKDIEGLKLAQQLLPETVTREAVTWAMTHDTETGMRLAGIFNCGNIACKECEPTRAMLAGHILIG